MAHRIKAVVTVVLVGCLCGAAGAQLNATTQLLDSPVKIEGEVYAASGVVMCSVALPSTASMFGCDTVTGTLAPVEMFAGELFGSFRVWSYDENCVPTATWSTALVGGTTMTGLAMENGDTAHYWAVTLGGSVNEYVYGVGTATGASIPFVTVGAAGSAVIDDNQAGEILCINDIVLDTYTCVDMLASGAFVCSYANVDNSGGGAFGNGHGDAVFPADCSGATLVHATGELTAGGVERVGQYDCGVVDPACSDRWCIGSITAFTNGIEEFERNGDRCLQLVDNAASRVVILCQVHEGCQDIDPDMNLIFVNASQGGPDYTVEMLSGGPLGVSTLKTVAGNGRFVHHMRAGFPDAGTITPLFDLGNACFDFLTHASSSVIENNVGFTTLVGASRYFTATIPDPAKAPTFLPSLTQGLVDIANMPVGSQWTHQSIHVNSASSSKKGGSLSNAVCMEIQ